jgi:hypothetical protein
MQAGESGHLSGGSVSLVAGFGSMTNSSNLVLKTSNTGRYGVSGKINILSGTTSKGDSGAANIFSGSALSERGGSISIKVGSGSSRTGGFVYINAGETIDNKYGGNI